MTVAEATSLRVYWLAGYPRSGAALIRTILAHCFGHGSASFYQEGGLSEHYAEAVGLCSIPQTVEESEALAERQPVLTIKSHEWPERHPKALPTLVIVRDGRRLFESLRAFYQECNEETYSMLELIRGVHPWGDWSEWIRAWARWTELPVRWIRYEDIMADVDWAIRRLAAWLQIHPVAWEIPPFEAIQQGSPGIFRKAAVSGNGGMTVDEESAFWDRHGAVMSMLGYRR